MKLQFLGFPCGIYEGPSGTVTGSLLLLCVFHSKYHSAIAPYPFVHLSLTLYNLSK